ncbi:MAG: hypothetical protein ACLTWR_08185 [Agathobaculum desmolans]|uniref:hypothetical protein n=1 Tax=Agathobaculum desmolans TaxID=39484 RepID=UPI0039929687
MYKIKTDESYNERFASLSFVNGEATTDDPWLAAWCEGRGFQVEQIAESESMKKPSGKRGRKDDEGKSAGEGESAASGGDGADA